MYKQILRAIADVGVFGSISLIIFFSIFAYVTYRVVTARKSHITKMSNLPLEDSI
jgi:hypothetical protein